MYSKNDINQNIFSSCKRFHTQLVWVFFTIESDSALKIFNACANFTKSFFLDFSHSTSQSWCFTSPLKKKAKMQLKLWEIRKIVLWFFLGTRSKQQCFTIFRNLIKIVDWIGFGIFFILAIATVKESWEAYLNSATSWSIEMHPIQHQPTFYLAFSLSANTIHSVPFHLKLGKDFNITFTANSKR